MPSSPGPKTFAFRNDEINATINRPLVFENDPVCQSTQVSLAWRDQVSVKNG